LRSSNDEAKRRRVPPIRGLGKWKDAMHKGARRHGRLPKGVALLLKATLPTCPQTTRAESSPTRSTGSEQKKPNRRAWCTQPPSSYKRPPHFCPDQRAKGAGCHAGGMQPRQVDALLRLPTCQHGGPGPRVTQPARQMLHASNCTATCATTTPLRLRNQYRDSRRPSARPSSASLARRSIQPKVGRQ
jgi:hypothetical protein